MGKRMYELWKGASEKAKNVAFPFDAGSGVAAALLNFAMNAAVSPVTVPASLPIFGVAGLAKLGFKREAQVVIPRYSFEAIEAQKTSSCVGKILRDQVEVLVVQDQHNGYTFPTGSRNKDDGWFDPLSIGVTDGHITWIGDAWDDRRKVHVTYFLMMQGTVPQIEGGVWMPASALGMMIPEETLKSITRFPKEFEYWKGMKFDLKYSEQN
jgi:hypothetical protein